MAYQALLPIVLYFLLNLIVTTSNKWIVSRTSCPYLLTVCHASCTWFTTSVLSRLGFGAPEDHQTANKDTPRTSERDLRRRVIVVCFSLLYTVNIAISNLSLGLVSLSLHQTIRATSPAITVLLSVTLLRKPLSSYSLSTYLSLVPTVAGVIIATSATEPGNGVDVSTTSLSGIVLTLLGAFLAVFKTILTHSLQCRTGPLGLNMSSMTLVRRLSPYAVGQALFFAFWTGEFGRAHAAFSSPAAAGSDILKIGSLNALAAAALNIASFEANHHSGPLAMAVAANLKQVVILIAGRHSDGDGGRVVCGALMTVAGGLWYAFAHQADRREEKN